MEFCKVCKSETDFIFKGKILQKYLVSYYKCKNCGFVQTEKPYWLEESYGNSINLVDTGLTRRNIAAAKSVSALLYLLFDRKAKYLDYAGGYGMFARIMRDIGFDFYTTDPFTPNLLARGFDYDYSSKIELVTTFESFEHFNEPIEEIEKILAISRNIFFSTQLIPEPTPGISDWWYYGTDHGQHIAFYSKKTLIFLAKKFNLNIYRIRGYHMLSQKKIPSLLFKLIVAGGRYGLNILPISLLKSKTQSDRDLLSSNH